MINIKELDPNKIKLGEKSYENTVICYKTLAMQQLIV